MGGCCPEFVGRSERCERCGFTRAVHVAMTQPFPKFPEWDAPARSRVGRVRRWLLDRFGRSATGEESR